MNKKLLFSVVVAGMSCVAYSSAFMSNSSNTKLFKVALQESTHRVVLNKDNLVTHTYYDDRGVTYNRQYAFFNLDSPGNYTALNNNSYEGGTWGGDHLFTNTTLRTGVIYAFGINTIDIRSRNLYFDKAATRKINCPGLETLTKVEVTVGEGHTLPFIDDTVIPDGNTYTMTSSNLSNSSVLYLFSIVPESQSEVGLNIVIDEVVLTYTC